MSAIDAERTWAAVLDPGNLDLAWRRVARFLAESPNVIDQQAIGQFGASRQDNLRELAADIRAGSYRCAPARPVVWPKPTGGQVAAPALRTLYWIDPRDQVAWMALMNVIGPELDARIPHWSYGHRLHHGPGVRHLGPGRDAVPEDSYLWPPAQGWPLVQRHVLLAARRMLGGSIDVSALDGEERRVWEAEEARPPDRRCRWLTDPPAACQCHAVMFDLKNYSGSIGLAETRQAMERHGGEALRDPRLARLLDGLFDVRQAGVGASDPPVPLDQVPVGLAAQGPLNNVAMLDVDLAADAASNGRGIAHFRFVDDHIVLGRDPEAILDWLDRYRGIVRAWHPGLGINHAKMRPEGFGVDPGPGKARAADTRFDPDQPQSLWTPVPFRAAPAEAARTCPWDLRIDAATNRQLLATIAARPMPHPDGGFPDPVPPAQFEADRFAAGREMIRRFRDRRGLMIGALRHAAQTGYPSLSPLCDDLLAFAALSPRGATASAALMLQQLAILVPASVLRWRSFAQADLRARCASFLRQLDDVMRLEALDRSEWQLRRAWSEFACGIAVARGLAVMAPAEPGLAAMATIFDRLPQERDVEKVADWLAWFRDFDPPGDEAVAGDLSGGQAEGLRESAF